MNDCKELTYAQVRELAIARYVDDNKISIGVWAKQNGYIKKKRQKEWLSTNGAIIKIGRAHV